MVTSGFDPRSCYRRARHVLQRPLTSAKKRGRSYTLCETKSFRKSKRQANVTGGTVLGTGPGLAMLQGMTDRYGLLW